MSSNPAFPLKPVLAPDAWDLLNSLPHYSAETSDEMNITLRKRGWDPHTVAAVLTQLRLRRDARSKFGGFAERMLFTPDGLQQSTRLPVAARHARRFRDAGLAHVADLGSGLGADSLAFASAGLSVTAVESDETTAAAAYINLRPFPEAEVVHATAEDFSAEHNLQPAHPESADKQHHPPAGWGVWLDPARRNQHSRLWDPEEFSPPLSFVTKLASTGLPLGVKLGPGIPHGLIPAGCEAEWVSLDGDLVEVVLWFNALARTTAEGSLIRRSASVLTTQGGQAPTTGLPPVSAAELTSSTEFGDGISLPASGPDGLTGVLWEPDSAVIRAGLVAELCEQFHGRMLDEHIAYFCTYPPGGGETPLASRPDAAAPAITPQGPPGGGETPLASRPDAAAPAITPQDPPGDEERAPDVRDTRQRESGHADHVTDPLARGYQVLEVMKFSAKRLKQWCAEHQITSLEIKKRGVDVVPEQLRRQVLPKRRKGQPSSVGSHATLIITRLGDERLAAAVRELG